MPTVNLSSGGVRANLRAGEDIAASTVWKYSSTENEVTLCGSGEEADGICIAATAEAELLNTEGENYSRKETGVFSDVEIASNFTAGGEWMSGASGVITAYVASSDNRPLGKFLSSGLSGATGKITFYSK
mgnify:CR=1 FL=1